MFCKLWFCLQAEKKKVINFIEICIFILQTFMKIMVLISLCLTSTFVLGIAFYML